MIVVDLFQCSHERRNDMTLFTAVISIGIILGIFAGLIIYRLDKISYSITINNELVTRLIEIEIKKI